MAGHAPPLALKRLDCLSGFADAFPDVDVPLARPAGRQCAGAEATGGDGPSRPYHVTPTCVSWERTRGREGTGG